MSFRRPARRLLAPLLLALAAIRSLATEVPGQAASAVAPAPLTPEVRAEVVDSLAAAAARFYAVADTGALIAAHLRRRLASGAYGAITDRGRFADALLADLRAVNGDRHLAVAARAEPSAVSMGTATLPPPPADPPYDGAERPRSSTLPLTQEEARSPALLAARRSNFQMPRAEVLPGNVGYLELRYFMAGYEPEEKLVDALRFLEHTDALILDVRDHRGGARFTTRLILSHFFGPDTVHLYDVEGREEGDRAEVWTLPRVPGPRRPAVPLYVLTSRGTMSAGEAMAFGLKNAGRATLVGEATYGAGRTVQSFDVGHGFTAVISITTVQDPRTGAAFEGSGVAPHVAVPPRGALAAAHALALAELAEAEAEPARRRELSLTAEFVAAQDAGREVPVDVLQRYVGTYGGTERVVTVENGRLTWRRLPAHLGQELVSMSDTEFAPVGMPALRMAFEPDGARWRLRQVLPNGQSFAFEYTGPPPAIPSEYD